MAVKTVFYGNDNVELECFLDGGISIGVYNMSDNQPYGNTISLPKEDVRELIKVLTELESRMA